MRKNKDDGGFFHQTKFLLLKELSSILKLCPSYFWAWKYFFINISSLFFLFNTLTCQNKMSVILLFLKPACWSLNHWLKMHMIPKRNRTSIPSSIRMDTSLPIAVRKGPETMALISRTGTLWGDLGWGTAKSTVICYNPFTLICIRHMTFYGHGN